MTNYQTMQRKVLTEFLQSNPDVQFSAKEIFNILSNTSISLSAVYRNLSSLEADGIISRFTKEGSRESFYQYINSDICRNSIHLVCTKCNKTFHMHPEEMKRMLESIEKSEGFIVNNTKTILYGICKSCT
ncbi:Fur family transcriptional regulator [Anaerotignum sp.]|uniref:Fur family transcriptional regulator n=1 Tax=Anaerotignum sp. TaxID=2039241 RepID=UPI003324F698